jgi:hypothetical protein
MIADSEPTRLHLPSLTVEEFLSPVTAALIAHFLPKAKEPSTRGGHRVARRGADKFPAIGDLASNNDLVLARLAFLFDRCFTLVRDIKYSSSLQSHTT